MASEVTGQQERVATARPFHGTLDAGQSLTL